MVNDPSHTYLTMELCFPKNKYEHPEVPPNLLVDCSFKLLSTVYTQCAKVYQIYSQKQVWVLEANPAPPQHGEKLLHHNFISPAQVESILTTTQPEHHQEPLAWQAWCLVVLCRLAHVTWGRIIPSSPLNSPVCGAILFLLPPSLSHIKNFYLTGCCSS